MYTLGIDLAAQDAGTAICRIAWRDGAALIEELRLGIGNETLLAAIARADKAGIDVPLGWPDAFVEAITSHHMGRTWPQFTVRELCYRETDRVVAELTGRWPLSVSSAWIAITAMRAAAVLGRLAPPVDRAGGGQVVEVYPAAALRRWGFDPSGYKQAKGLETRRALVASLVGRTQMWLHLESSDLALCEHSDDALDALIASLVARAFVLGLCERIPPESNERAKREGWIALPTRDSLERLDMLRNRALAVVFPASGREKS